MSEREELRREFSFENVIPNGPWYTFDTEKALDEIAALRNALTTAERALDEARREREALRAALAFEEEQHDRTQKGHAKALGERDEARRERDEIVLLCRGTTMSASGLRSLESLRSSVKRMKGVVEAAKALDYSATVARLNPDDVAMRYAELHIALNELRALDAAEGTP